MRRVACAFSLLMLGALSVSAQNPDGVGFRAAVAPDTVYVGQQITYTLSVRIPTAVRQRLRRNPEFVPPEPRAMLAYDLPLARVADPDAAVEIHTFRRALFVLTPGRYTIGQARLSYSLPQSASFFSREDDRTLRADGVSFVAIDPPSRGRPAGWLGAVGQWSVRTRAEPTSTRVGDPFVLVLRIEGTGNATLLPRPPLAIAWGDVVAQDERVVLDSTPAMFGGAKEFTWLVTPREEGARTVPVIEYPIFNPVARQYQIVRTLPITVSVRPGTLVAVPVRAAAREDSVVLPLRTTLDGSSMVQLPFAVTLAWIALLAPLPWLVLRIAPKLGRRAKDETKNAPRTTRAVLEQSLRARTGVDLAAHTTPGALTAALRLQGVTAETAAEVEAVRDACDAQGFARTRVSSAHPASLADSVRARASAALAKVNAEARKRVMLLVLTLGLVTGCVRITESADAVQAFAEGRTAYAGADYPRARAAFGRAALRAPRDASAWANYGTAGWAARDTAAAVYGWQRSLRLNPTSDDVRERLARVPAPQHRGAARVWPVAPWPVLMAGLLLWLAGWGWAAVVARRTQRSRWPLALIVPGAMLIATGAWLENTLAARDLAVITTPAPLRSLPALGSDPGAMPITGEVARIAERRGVWVRLELDGERTGWYPADRVLSLARD